MNASISGLITLAGLLVAFGFVVWPSNKEAIHIHVVKTWWILFGIYLFNTAMYFLQTGVFNYWYFAPSAAALLWFLCMFYNNTSMAAYVVAAIFVLNVVGSLLGAGQWQVATIDILDVFVWLQIAALIQLARENPDPVLSRPYDAHVKRDNIMRMIGYVRRSTERTP